VRRRVAAAIPLALLAALAAAWLMSSGSGSSPAGGATQSDVPLAEVQRRTLAEQVTVDGTIGYAGKATVVNRLSGTVTGLPKVGQVIRRGQALFGVDNKPVILMYGELPAYRRLAEGLGGEDVRQLEENLVALGYDPGTVDGEFTSTTAAAVSAWQDDLDLPVTGAVELGRVVFLPSARRVTEVSATLGADGSSSGGSGLASARGDDADGDALLVAYDPSTDPTTTTPDWSADHAPDQPPDSGQQPGGTQPQNGAGNPANGGGNRGDGDEDSGKSKPENQAPSSQTPSAGTPPAAPTAQPAQNGDGSTDSPSGGSGGSGSTPSAPVLETSSTRRIVSAQVDADQQDLVRPGQRVEVSLPDGRQAHGKVTRLEAISSSGDQATGGTEAGVEATIKLVGRGRIPALDGAAVSVSLTDEVRRNVLTVPLTSLISIGANRFAVIAHEGSRTRQVVVTPGLAAEGYVEVEGEGLREGMQVEAPE
jgi:multidrug efflux pump subunit AcrA (membrane-fusion protein)